MSIYQPEAGEILIMRDVNALLYEGEELQNLDEIVLTDRQMVLVMSVRKGFFSRETLYKRCKLNTLLCDDGGVPKVMVVKDGGKYVLQVPFRGETVLLRFTSGAKMLSNKWADAIVLAAAGRSSEIVAGSGVSPDFADMVDSAADVARAAAGMFGFSGVAGDETRSVFGASKRLEKSRPVVKTAKKTSAKCPGCHAPLTGKVGATVTCEYCGASLTLEER